MTDSHSPHILETHTPADQAALVQIVSDCQASRTAIYPIGGGTSLGYGLLPRLQGIGLSTTGIARVIDYPARDMTITVEAGVRVAELQRILAGERQTLPIDVPQSEQATIGGIVAADTSGPRRYMHGTLRDYVIGISAVDGRGVAFKAGGRVVKNVAGYDFCKLLTGSVGTLAVITQVTFKVKPLPQRTALLVAPLQSAQQAEAALDILSQSQATPAVIELLADSPLDGDPQPPASPGGTVGTINRPITSSTQGKPIRLNNPLAKQGAKNFTSSGFGALAIRIEGTEPEVAWMIDTLIDELSACAVELQTLDDQESQTLWQRIVEFPAAGGIADSPSTTLQIIVPPSRTVDMLELIRQSVPRCSLQAHAGNGIIVARLDDMSSADVSRLLVSKLQPAAQQLGGRAVVLSSPTPGELTRQAVWGTLGDSVMLMNAVKQQFDPLGLLNPGRFVYSIA